MVCLVPLLLILLLCYITFLLISSVSLTACLRGVVFAICCLFRLYWLVPLLPYNFTNLPLLPLYIACICPLGVAGLHYDKAPFKGAYLLVLVLLGWYLYLSFLSAWLVSKSGRR